MCDTSPQVVDVYLQQVQDAYRSTNETIGDVVGEYVGEFQLSEFISVEVAHGPSALWRQLAADIKSLHLWRQ